MIRQIMHARRPVSIFLHYLLFKAEFQPVLVMMSSYNVKLRRVGIVDYDTQIKGRTQAWISVKNVYSLLHNQAAAKGHLSRNMFF